MAEMISSVRSTDMGTQQRSFALMTAAFGVGQIAGPLAAGWLMDRTRGFVAASLIGAAALVLGATIAMRTTQTLAAANSSVISFRSRHSGKP